MTAATILIVEEIGMYNQGDFGVVRGRPGSGLGFELRACLVGRILTGKLLQTREPVALDVDFADVAACRNAVVAAVRLATTDALIVTGEPVYPGHCWRNGGWAPCPQVYSFVVHERNNDGTAGPEYGPDIGFLNGLQLKTRFLGVIQTP